MVLTNLSKQQIKIFKKQLQYNFDSSNYTDTNKSFTTSKISTKALIDYLGTEPLLIYPVKSYAVAIIYSLLLEKEYKIGFWDSIANPLLLSANDRFFVPYTLNKTLYKQCISYYGKNNILTIESNTVKIITSYFYEEFIF